MNKQRSGSAFFKSALLLTVGGFLGKLIGAFYRVPLTNLVGGYGMGVYQMAYPLFALLLTFSSAGIPNAFARIVAKETKEGRSPVSTVRRALALFFFIGGCGTALMLLLAPLLSRVRGELYSCYLALAPSVLCASLIAVLRGYFQGKNDMKPTVLSELFEQAFKTVFGLFFAYLYRGEPLKAVTGALFAVSISEAFSLAFLYARFCREKERLRFRKSGERIFSAALPAMLAAAILPLSQMADSTLLVKLLGGDERAVALYGLFAGAALSLVNLPASVCSGISVAAVPAVASDEEGAKHRSVFVLGITLVLALPCAVGLFFFAEKGVTVLYPSLRGEERETLVSLLRLLSPSAALLAGVQSLAACLTGKGRAGRAALSMAVAVLVKTGLQIALVQSTAFSVYGGAIAVNGCYSVAFFLDLVYTVTVTRSTRKGSRNYDHDHRTGSTNGRFNGACRTGASTGGQGGFAYRAHSLRKNA